MAVVRGVRRPNLRLDLPHLPVAPDGTVDAEEVHHFWRSLIEWANAISDTLDNVGGGGAQVYCEHDNGAVGSGDTATETLSFTLAARATVNIQIIAKQFPNAT